MDLSIERSLLQKSIRRGAVEITEKVFYYLYQHNDLKWLRNRLPIIAYEECWTAADQLYDDQNPRRLLEQYKTLASTVKNKNAAGLATLAHYYKGGDKSILRNANPKQRNAIESISNAIKDPTAFWEWVTKQQPNYTRHNSRIEAARKSEKKANFETDRAMMYAAAYLAVKGEIPETATSQLSQPLNSPNFPYWIAFDKHTETGRLFITKAAENLQMEYFLTSQLFFFLEGAKCNKVTASPYWDLAVEWKMRKTGYANDQLKIIWNKLRPELMRIIREEAEELKERIEADPKPNNEGDQLGLF